MIQTALRMVAAVVVALSCAFSAACSAQASGVKPAAHARWHFMVAGDSRNCGDVVMPSLAAAARAEGAQFYWHLGDLRAIYDFDEDFHHLNPKATIIDYETRAWDDFIRHQVEPFGAVPFFLGIGNHETIQPKTRDQFVSAFADWLNADAIRTQRLLDDPHDHQVRAYYHWIRDGVDFIYLDNATPEQFDAAQMAWFKAAIARDRASANIRAVVLGMHEALPDSIASGHSMSDFPTATVTGRAVYQLLLDLKSVKPVYVLASHSHFVMQGIFNTQYLRDHGGVLPGWIVGTGGAVRYVLPPNSDTAEFAATNVYGYLLATVAPSGTADPDPVHFEFHEVHEQDVPATVTAEFGAEFIHSCYADNRSTAGK